MSSAEANNSNNDSFHKNKVGTQNLNLAKMRIVNNVSAKWNGGVHMNGDKEKKKSKFAQKIPRGLRPLPFAPIMVSDTRSDFGALKQEAARIEQWWSSPRWNSTKRVYSGKQSEV
jgi:hypothetical protein